MQLVDNYLGGGANKVRAAICLRGEGAGAEAKIFFKIQEVYESKLE